MIALITGVTGQDGSYLAELLLSKGYVVHGMIRRSSLFNTERIDHIFDHPNFELHYGDLSDSLNVLSILKKTTPDEIYNLGAMSHVKVSFEMPEYTANVDALGTLRLLEGIRILGLKSKFYQASTSELYGMVQEIPQKESTPFYPRSPYAVAKLYSYWITRNYREAYGIHASNGILFNHESPRRGGTFVTRKVTKAIARMVTGEQSVLRLGNIYAKRDWGHAKDYVEAMYLMMQQPVANDLVIATGQSHSVKEMVTMAFDIVGMKLEWSATGGYVNGNRKVAIDKKYYRPTEVDELLGDSSIARELLDWSPKYSMRDMLTEMIEHDIKHIDSKYSKQD
jgi:GDPmannose 4,6-dehydratase